MQNSKQLLEELSNLLRYKKSKEFYADRLGISTEMVNELLNEIRNSNEVDTEIDSTISKRVNLNKGEIEVSGYWDDEPTPEQIIKAHKIDTSKWKLVQFWSKQKEKGWQVSALFSQLKLTKEEYRHDFENFIKTYKPVAKKINPSNKFNFKTNACLIFNKQDSHLNKYDVLGDNNIEDRFNKVYNKTEKILIKASAVNNLEKIVYIIGSDEFNSEYTSTTTGGTPQQNILSYHEGFEKICNHEINIINMLLGYTSNLEVIYVPGNHDEHVGWHMVSWLRAFFREQENLTIDSSELYTKYVKYSNTAMCFNHGYGMKPEKLAAQFPIEYKDNWSSCDFYYVFTGDKHHNISRDIEGIRFYQIPALSGSVSKWDLLHGYKSKPEMTSFLIEKDNGLTDVYREIL